MKAQFILIALGAACLACGQNESSQSAPDALEQKPDDRGETSEKESHGKSDAWNRRNNPAGLRVELNKTLADLPLEGEAENRAWPDTYWPTYKDSVNARWQSTGEFLKDLSPVEKYDVAFNGWDPTTVQELRPFDGSDCAEDSFDEEYYEKLGPLASYVSNHKGNKATRDAALKGELDDRCKAKEESECISACGDAPEDETELSIHERCLSRCDRGGVETWWGLCHAWAPAAILEKEPLHPVIIPTEYGDIQFEVGDIKALFALMYDRSRATLIGGRCNDFDVKRDETTGRIINEDCRDLNAGAFHVAMSNLLGLQKRGFVEDRTFDYEVWNQPVKGFEVSEMEEISIEEAHALLNVDVENPTDCLSGFDQEDNGYCYNRNVDTLFKVKTSLHWLTESSASTLALGATHMSRYSRTDTYTYILEVKDGDIVGGEWYGDSIEAHPDFVWLPFGPGYTAERLEIESVRMLNRLAQKSAEERAAPVAPVKVDSDAIEVHIPDNRRGGVHTTLLVEDDTLTDRVVHVKVNVDIEHTYSGDLKIEIKGPNGESRVLRDRRGGSTHNVQESYDVPYSDDINGEWTLIVSDLYSRDTGAIKNWSIVFTAETVDTDADASVTATNDHQATIPDNDPEGINSYIDIDSDANIDGVEIEVDIKHTYVGDLVITLKKGGVSQVLHNREGGSDDDLKTTFKTDAFKGMPAAGRWYLNVKDLARADIGTRDAWTIRITH